MEKKKDEVEVRGYCKNVGEERKRVWGGYDKIRIND